MSDTTPPPASDLPSSWQAEDDDAIRADRSSRKWWIIGGIVLVVLLVPIGLALSKLGDDEPREWPSTYEGRPEGLGGEKESADEVTPTAEPGVYIWNGFDGWHVWVVNGDGLDGLSGTITSNDDIVSAESSVADGGKVTLEGEEVTFDLEGGGAVTGIDFDPGFSKELKIDLLSASGDVSASQVFTGSKSAPASSVPVVIEKELVD
jgi:hypothetical protein